MHNQHYPPPRQSSELLDVRECIPAQFQSIFCQKYDTFNGNVSLYYCKSYNASMIFYLFYRNSIGFITTSPENKCK